VKKSSLSQLLNIFDWLGSLNKALFYSNAKLSDERKIELVRGIAAGVLHLHKHNVIHRDLAARNILLTSIGEPKIFVR
jgi:serine/threonine protein kinase